MPVRVRRDIVDTIGFILLGTVLTGMLTIPPAFYFEAGGWVVFTVGLVISLSVVIARVRARIR